jgi:hypothetical protein
VNECKPLIGGKNRGGDGAEDLFHLTPYSKLQSSYHYVCAGHDDVLPAGAYTRPLYGSTQALPMG